MHATRGSGPAPCPEPCFPMLQPSLRANRAQLNLLATTAIYMHKQSHWRYRGRESTAVRTPRAVPSHYICATLHYRQLTRRPAGASVRHTAAAQQLTSCNLLDDLVSKLVSKHQLPRSTCCDDAVHHQLEHHQPPSVSVLQDSKPFELHIQEQRLATSGDLPGLQ